MTTPTMIAGYLALFIGFGFFFLWVNLLVGKFLRPKNPNFEKLEIYECGEPTIGSSFVQFDIRFYVVALLFIIFDVEIAFFFPWATVFGKATQLMNPAVSVMEQGPSYGRVYETDLSPAAANLLHQLGVPKSARPTSAKAVRATAEQLAGLSIVDILVFFAVLMVGFAYVWKRGDLDWVRSVGAEEATGGPEREPPSLTVERETALSA
jgi:NADH-quinone oxidoreductase subunit A